MHAVSGDPGERTAVAQHRTEVEQAPAAGAFRRRRIRQDGQRDGEGPRGHDAAGEEGGIRPGQRGDAARQGEGQCAGEAHAGRVVEREITNSLAVIAD